MPAGSSRRNGNCSSYVSAVPGRPEWRQLRVGSVNCWDPIYRVRRALRIMIHSKELSTSCSDPRIPARKQPEKLTRFEGSFALPLKTGPVTLTAIEGDFVSFETPGGTKGKFRYATGEFIVQ